MKLFTILFLTLILSFSAFAQSKTNAKMAQQFTATSIDGKTFNLKEMKDKVVVLVFWGTYCPICISEMPELNKIAADYKDKDVIFLAVSPENESNIRKFLKKKQFDFNQIPNGMDLMAKFADVGPNGNFTMPTPTHIVINKGVIELKFSGRDKNNKLKGTLERLLKT